MAENGTVEAPTTDRSDAYARFGRLPLPQALTLALVLPIIAGVVGIAVAFVFLSAIDMTIGAESIWVSMTILLISIQGLGFMGTSLAFVGASGLSWDFFMVRWPTLRDGLWFIGGLIGSFLLIMVAVMVVTQGLGSPPEAENNIVSIAEQSPDVLLLLIPMAYLLIGPGEEILFRGTIQGTLRRAMSPLPAIFISSVIFAAIHVLALQGASMLDRILAASILFFPSAVFGIIYERTENILIPAMIHATYDAILFGLLYLSLTGQIPTQPS